MGTLFGFVVGYIVGARAGSVGFDELVDSVRAIRDSEEFSAFMGLLGEHTRSTAQQLGGRFLTAPERNGNGGGRLREHPVASAAEDALRAARERLGK